MELLPFQTQAKWDMMKIIQSRRGVYNAYEMGLGKTIQSLSVCDELNYSHILIICPAVVRLVWRNEIEKFIPHKKDRFEIVSYEMATKNAEDLSNQHFDCLILDEAHKVKNHKTLRSQAIFQHLWPKIPYKICLSGTPFTQSVLDCWTLFSRLAPEHFEDYWKFANTYTKVKRTPWGPKFEGVKNAEQLKKIIRSTFFIRETLETVGHELPDKTWQKIILPESLAVKMTAEQEKAHKEYIKKVIASFKSDHPTRRPVPPVSSSTWRKEQGIKKLPAILEFSQNLLDQGIPTVLMCYHREFANKLKKGLKKFNPVVITGDTNEKDRSQAVRAFQEGGTNCFIGNIQAAGIGITLTRSSTMLFGEYSWIPSDIQQSVARILRIGQKNHVNIYYFVVENSIDEEMIEAVIERSKDFKSVLGG